MRAPEDRPPVEFWEDALEFPVTRLMENAKSPQFMNDWVQRRGPRQVAMLRHLLGLPAGAPLRERKEERGKKAPTIVDCRSAIRERSRPSSSTTATTKQPLRNEHGHSLPRLTSAKSRSQREIIFNKQV